MESIKCKNGTVIKLNKGKSATWETTIRKDGVINATGIEIPVEVIESFGKGKKPPVKVTVNGFTYQTTAAFYNGEFVVPLSQERRAAAKVESAQKVKITVELDLAPRIIVIPEELKKALSKEKLLEKFETLAPSKRKEFAT